MLSISPILLLEIQVELFKDYMSFFETILVIAAWLMNSIEIFYPAQVDKLNSLIQTLAAWFTQFLDFFAARIYPYDLQ